MKLQSKLLTSAIALGLVCAGAASAQPVPRSDAFVLEMFGQRAWQVSCELSQSDGDTVTTRDHGRGLLHNARAAVGDVTGGTCSYSVPDQGELRLTINLDHSDLECPFTVNDDGFCRASFAAGATGSFDVTRTALPAAASSLTN
jgi:hypothetical protein